MKQYICSICSYTYDEEKGIPKSGIAPETSWEDLPDGWKCPLCGADKSQFREKIEQVKPASTWKKPHVERELSAMEMSVICSNLAQGCEKQYLPQQAEDFRELAAFFKAEAEPVQDATTQKLLELIENDLSVGYPYGNAISAEKSDRGALRCQAWSEKVTRMHQSLLTRYEAEGDRMLENTGVWVCTVCGFVYVGDTAPEKCPVCKVPSWKFEKMEGRA